MKKFYGEHYGRRYQPGAGDPTSMAHDGCRQEQHRGDGGRKASYACAQSAIRGRCGLMIDLFSLVVIVVLFAAAVIRAIDGTREERK